MIVSRAKFVKAWCAAAKANRGLSAIAEDTGLTIGCILARSHRMRRDGIKLPPLRKQVEPSTEQLNQLIEGLMK